MKAELLEKEFQSRAIWNESRRLVLRTPDALALVDRASVEGVPILGLSGRAANTRKKASEHMVDYSAAVGQGHGCWEAAEAYIRERVHLGLLYEVVLGDDPVEAV